MAQRNALLELAPKRGTISYMEDQLEDFDPLASYKLAAPGVAGLAQALISPVETAKGIGSWLYDTAIGEPLEAGQRSFDAVKAKSAGVMPGSYADDSGQQYSEGNPSFDAFMAASLAPIGGIAAKAVPETAAVPKAALAANSDEAAIAPMLARALEENPRGFTAYHESPFDFDAFSLSNVGSSESRRYAGGPPDGYGLYFARHPEDAREYRTKGGMSYEANIKAQPDQFMVSSQGLQDQPESVRAAFASLGASNHPHVIAARDVISQVRSLPPNQKSMTGYKSLLANVANAHGIAPDDKLYSELKSFVHDAYFHRDEALTQPTARNAYRYGSISKKTTSQLLRENGIAGMHTAPERGYTIMFDDSAIDITKKAPSIFSNPDNAAAVPMLARALEEQGYSTEDILALLSQGAR